MRCGKIIRIFDALRVVHEQFGRTASFIVAFGGRILCRHLDEIPRDVVELSRYLLVN